MFTEIEILARQSDSMESDRNHSPAETVQQTEFVGADLKSEMAALRAQLIDKEAALRDKQGVIKELQQNLQKARAFERHLAETPSVIAGLEAEIDDLLPEIDSLTARLADLETAMDGSQTDIGMADPRLGSFDGEAALLKSQLWVKEVALQLKKHQLAEKENAFRAQLTAVAELEGNGTAAVHEFTAKLKAKEATGGFVGFTWGELVDDLRRSLRQKESLLEALDAEIQSLRAEISGLVERMAQLESARAQAQIEAQANAARIRESFEAERVTLNRRLKEKEAELHAKQARAEELERRVNTTTDSLRAQLGEKETRLRARDGEIQKLKIEIDELLERIAQLQSAIERARAEAVGEAERLRENAKTEVGSLRAELHEQAEALALARGKITELEEALGAKEVAVRGLAQNLKANLVALQEELAAKAAAVNARDEEILALRSSSQTLEEQSAQLRLEIRRVQEAADGERERISEQLKTEAAALHSGLTERDAALRDKQHAWRDLEEALRAKIGELESRLSEKQALLEKRDGHLIHLQAEKDELIRRLDREAAALAAAQETAAARIEQLRRESVAEVEALQASLRESEEALQKSQIVIGALSQLVADRDRELQGQLPMQKAALEEAQTSFNARIAELESCLSEKGALLESRDSDIIELQADLERLVERNDQTWDLVRHAQAEAAIQFEQVKERLEKEVAFLRERLRDTEAARQATEGAATEAEECFNVSLQDLQVQLTEKQALLENRNDEIERLTAEIASWAQRSAQPEGAIKLVEREAGSEVELIGENERGGGEMLHAAVCEGEESFEKEPADIIELEDQDEIKIYGAEPLPAPEQPCAQGRNGNGGDLKDELPEWMGPSAPDGQSLPFSLFNLPPGVERATDMFSLKFMQQYKFFPMKLPNGSLAVAMSDTSDVYTLDAISLQAGPEVKVYAGDERQIAKVLEQHCGPSSSMDRIVQDIEDEGSSAEDGDGDVAHLKDLASEAPVIRLVNLVIAKAVEDRASDIHIEPFDESLRVRYRIDGLLVDTESPPPRLQAAIVSRIKLMAKMNIAERRLPQDGRIMMDIGGRQLDLRVSTIPTLYGESVVMRLLDRASVLLAPDDLGFPTEVRQRFDALIRRPNGIILVTGPTGSGKTTTLYAALSSINSIEKNIITIEDPVEYQLRGVKQIQVRPKIGLTFATGLRHIVRQDPDVILVGEIRDRETADIAIHAALTGHLVLSTLHTNDAAGAVTRLLDMGIQNYLVSSTLLAVLAQRLVRRICSHCRSAYSPDKETLAQFGVAAAEKRDLVLYKGKGCAECSDTGYFGRLGIFELLAVEGGVQRLILEKTDSGNICDQAVAMGMKTLWRDGLEKVVAGVTTLDEVLRVTWEG